MALYHDAAFTLDPAVPIPADAPPAIGITESGQADDLQVYSEEYVGANLIALTATIDGLYLTVDVTYPGELPAGAEVFWEWGDGRSETGHDLRQGHPYVLPGVYRVQATFTTWDQPSVTAALDVVL